jgi:IS5 family transposase
MPLYREFARIDAGCDRLPGESTMLRFRHLLERHDLAANILQTINAQLLKRGLMLKAGTVVDATLLSAPSSTKNSSGERGPEMHQTKKGGQWYFDQRRGRRSVQEQGQRALDENRLACQLRQRAQRA